MPGSPIASTPRIPSDPIVRPVGGAGPPIRIFFFGGARTVTGSMHVIEVAGKRILLECGLFQGRRREAEERNRYFPFAAARLRPPDSGVPLAP